MAGDVTHLHVWFWTDNQPWPTPCLNNEACQVTVHACHVLNGEPHSLPSTTVHTTNAGMHATCNAEQKLTVSQKWRGGWLGGGWGGVGGSAVSSTKDAVEENCSPTVKWEHGEGDGATLQWTHAALRLWTWSLIRNHDSSNSSVCQHWWAREHPSKSWSSTASSDSASAGVWGLLY